MTERKTYIDRIIKLLGFIRNTVELSSSISLYDNNIFSENFYRDFLNLLFNYKLVNINIQEKNSAAIDLGDLENRIAIQVTSTRDLLKTRKTVKTFIKNGLHKNYDRLILLNIISKTDHTVTSVGDKNIFEISTKENIWDNSDLLRKINDLETPKIKTILDFLEKEIKISNEYTIPNEIQTLNKLIELISYEEHISIGQGFIEDPDPKGKIYTRFANYSDFLEEEYKENYSMYGKVLDDVKQSTDMSQVKLRKLSSHLKVFSDNILKQENGNPREALSFLVEHYKDQLSTLGINYDIGAIRFFLVDQLIACNVFPNYNKNIV
ncbi:SMEK domain-containing protein [Cyclobacterium sp. SYSU L10401]|uniref:SMEK domain-containing protein n=1 Tax=Cyclobacterium sp. SYSU L10401 TaxID=2678657 RepID=UPI0013D7AC40|nr:SMEK domain-containing protein [Cyclobacterium sp. SYSU L10401]